MRARPISAFAVLVTFLCVGLHHDICRALTTASLGRADFFELHFETLVLFAALGTLAAIDTCVAEVRIVWVRRSIRALLVSVSLVVAIGAIAAWRR